MAQVNYNSKTVSDENVKTVLGRVATELDKDVNVSSGDRDAALDVGAVRRAFISSIKRRIFTFLT
jgi:hypothetical protein